MWPFKKKNTYKITYRDTYNQLCIVLVEATTPVQACREVEKRYAYPWYVQQIIEIEEITQ